MPPEKHRDELVRVSRKHIWLYQSDSVGFLRGLRVPSAAGMQPMIDD